MKIHRINPSKRWSDITVFNGIGTFTEVPEGDLDADIKGQVTQIFEQAKNSLALIDSDNSRVLAVTIYITDFSNMDGLNEVWDEWFVENCAPSRACVKAELSDSKYLVEMTFTVAAGEKFQS